MQNWCGLRKFFRLIFDPPQQGVALLRREFGFREPRQRLVNLVRLGFERLSFEGARKKGLLRTGRAEAARAARRRLEVVDHVELRLHNGHDDKLREPLEGLKHKGFIAAVPG